MHVLVCSRSSGVAEECAMRIQQCSYSMVKLWLAVMHVSVCSRSSGLAEECAMRIWQCSYSWLSDINIRSAHWSCGATQLRFSNQVSLSFVISYSKIVENKIKSKLEQFLLNKITMLSLNSKSCCFSQVWPRQKSTVVNVSTCRLNTTRGRVITSGWPCRRTVREHT